MSTPTPWPLHVVPESWCKERHYFEAYNAYQAALECPEDRVLRKRAKVTYRAWRDFEYEWKKRYSILIAVSRYEIIPETEQWGPVVDILVESFIRAFIRIVDLGGAKAITRELVDGLAEFNLLGATIKGLIGEKATTSERRLAIYDELAAALEKLITFLSTYSAHIAQSFQTTQAAQSAEPSQSSQSTQI